ncbi:MAG: VacB/RNase II family 3'-5' exoribonuclease, partial [Lentisphaerae bacterium]|nr:VacB/RNase II family 3'-5' exoribonuclease [Lentisphaerota bacterium]
MTHAPHDRTPTHRHPQARFTTDSLRPIFALAGRTDGAAFALADGSDRTAAGRPDDRLIADLVQRGWLTRERRDRLRAAGTFVEGTLAFTRAGSAFLESPGKGTLAFIPAGSTATAFPGDLVRAWLPPTPASLGRLPEGMIVEVLRRSRQALTAQVRRDAQGCFAMPLAARSPHCLRLPADTAVPEGTWVQVDMEPWNDPAQPPRGRVSAIIGNDADPATDDGLVLAEYGLPKAFPAAVSAEAEASEALAAETAGRVDLRDRFVITIDPAESRDFDDALSVRRVGSGLWELAVHVADVSHMVRPGTALDREARARGCSTYLPGRVIPMLPERLSNDLCSLNPGVDRLAMTALILMSADGEVRKTRFVNSILRSRRRLTYAQALAALNDSPSAANAGMDRRTLQTVRTLATLARALRERRRADGALELSSPEIRLELDGEGRVAGCTTVEQDDAHRLVEECMLAANEAACRTLAAAGLAQLHRVHPEPETSRLAETCQVLREAGVLKVVPTGRQQLAALFESLAGRPDAAAWTATLLRSLPRAEYAVDRQGHFGLAKSHYAHFTSPIRRYPDLITHRLLKAHLAGQAAALTAPELRCIALECSGREKISQTAERHLADIKRLRWLQDEARRHRQDCLDAIVTGVGPRGADLYLTGIG